MAEERLGDWRSVLQEEVEEPGIGWQSLLGETGLERNAPCPCGSGRKYKQCCLPKVELGQMALLAQQKLENGEIEAGDALLRQALRIPPHVWQGDAQLAKLWSEAAESAIYLAYDRCRYDEAMTLVQQASQTDVDHPQRWMLLSANLNHRLGHLAEGLQQATALLENHGLGLQAVCEVAEQLIDLRRYDEALRLILTASVIQGKDLETETDSIGLDEQELAQLRDELGRLELLCRLADGQLDEAWQLWQRRGASAYEACLWISAAVAFGQEGRFETLLKAVDDPLLVDFWKGVWNWHSGDRASAASHLQKVATLSRQDTHTEERVAASLYLGEASQAIGIAERALASHPFDHASLLQLAFAAAVAQDQTRCNAALSCLGPTAAWQLRQYELRHPGWPDSLAAHWANPLLVRLSVRW
ncbi:MAG: SEC-C domain-containing protein [Firmicutes bacterium]|nr:SEC-C domain-containing protein [Bacillota bacterium]